MKVLNTSISVLSYNEEDSILHIEMRPDADMNLETTKEHYAAINLITDNKKHYALINSQNYFTIDSESFKYASLSSTVNNRLACAHYNCSFANSLTVNFYKNNHRPGIPMNIFNTKEEALVWIKSLTEVFQTKK
ncbi:MAG: hypothetical protein HYX39_03655 [Bacteroidetes bacterium]|nr:hypothetical protein [Bacteroidota bacterium]